MAAKAGVCVFPDGSTCDEWAYFRGECGLAAQKSLTPAINVEATIANASGGFMPPDTTEEIVRLVGCHQEYGTRRPV